MDEVTAAGGRGVFVTRHGVWTTARSRPFERVSRESGHVDVLVNNAALIHEDMLKPESDSGRKPSISPTSSTSGSVGHYVATHHAIPLMVGRDNGLIVNVSFYGGARMHDPAYYACARRLDAFAATAAADLATVRPAIVSLWPGIVSTERVMGFR